MTTRLAGLDTAFVCLDSTASPMHLGAVLTFAPHGTARPLHVLRELPVGHKLALAEFVTALNKDDRVGLEMTQWNFILYDRVAVEGSKDSKRLVVHFSQEAETARFM